MNKTRTTISIPTDILKQAKHKAVEKNVSLSEIITRGLYNTLTYDNKTKKDSKSVSDAKQIEKLAGTINIKINLPPQKINKIIQESYE